MDIMSNYLLQTTKRITPNSSKQNGNSRWKEKREESDSDYSGDETT
jgi:hypothetical protein